MFIYTYFATKESDYNFQFFINYGLLDTINYIFVINGHKCNIEIPDKNLI